MSNGSEARIGDIDKARLLGVIDGLHATITGLAEANRQLIEANKKLVDTNLSLVRSMAEMHRSSTPEPGEASESHANPGLNAA